MLVSYITITFISWSMHLIILFGLTANHSAFLNVILQASLQSDIYLLQTNPLTSAESLLFVSTLDGSLHAINNLSGEIQWTLKEGR